MKARIVLATLVGCFAGLALYAADPNLGTWKLNESKSKLAPSGAKNTLVVYTAVGDSVKVTLDGVDWKGQTFKAEWTGKYDGKDYPVTGNPTTDTRACGATRRTVETRGCTNGAPALNALPISPTGKSPSAPPGPAAKPLCRATATICPPNSLAPRS